MTKRGFIERAERWPQRVRLRVVCLLGMLGWWLLGFVLLSGLGAGVGEPYWGWSGTLRGMRLGVQFGLAVSLSGFLPLAAIPILAACVVRLHARWQHSPRPSFRAIRAWLMAPWLLVPLGVVVAPCLSLHIAMSETTSDPSDPAPTWAGFRLLHLVGSPATAAGIVIGLLAIAMIGAGRAATRAGAQGSECPRCSYDLTGLALGAICPECGSTALLLCVCTTSGLIFRISGRSSW